MIALIVIAVCSLFALIPLTLASVLKTGPSTCSTDTTIDLPTSTHFISIQGRHKK